MRARDKECEGACTRAASELVRLAGGFRSDILLEKDGLEVNGKSIMGVLMLAAECGSKLRIRANGDDAEAALEALSGLVKKGFEEMQGG